MAICALIWDLDGTLADSYPAIVPAVREALAAFGLRLGEEEIRREVLLSSVGALIRRVSAENGLERAALQAAFDRCNAEGASRVRAMPHAAEALAALSRAGHRNFVYTHRGASCAAILAQTGLAPYITETVTALNGFPRKPAPDGILYLMRKYALVPARCYYVGVWMWRPRRPPGSAASCFWTRPRPAAPRGGRRLWSGTCWRSRRSWRAEPPQKSLCLSKRDRGFFLFPSRSELPPLIEEDGKDPGETEEHGAADHQQRAGQPGLRIGRPQVGAEEHRRKADQPHQQVVEQAALSTPSQKNTGSSSAGPTRPTGSSSPGSSRSSSRLSSRYRRIPCTSMVSRKTSSTISRVRIYLEDTAWAGTGQRVAGQVPFESLVIGKDAHRQHHADDHGVDQEEVVPVPHHAHAQEHRQDQQEGPAVGRGHVQVFSQQADHFSSSFTISTNRSSRLTGSRGRPAGAASRRRTAETP